MNLKGRLAVVMAAALVVTTLPAAVFAGNDGQAAADIAEGGLPEGYTGEYTILSKDVSVKDRLSYAVEDEGITITGYKGDGSSIYVPEFINGIAVTKIGDNAFDSNHDIVAVILPNTVTEIGNEAFNNCSKLTKVTAGGLEKVGDFAFFNCSRLKEVNTKNDMGSVREIGKGAFYGCQGMSEVYFGSRLAELGEYAFARCSNLNYAIFADENNALTEIKDKTFFECTSLTNFDIPQSVTGIGPLAFKGSGISQVCVGGNVNTIDREAFAECPKLQTVSVDAINVGEGAFKNCNALGSITLSEGVESLGKNAFANEKEEGIVVEDVVNIPASLKEIGQGAFMGLNVKAFGVDEHNDAYSASDGGLFDKSGEKLICASDEYVEKAMPEGQLSGDVKTLGYGAFSADFGLLEVSLTDGLEKIEGYALSRAGSLSGNTLPDSVESLEPYALSGLSFKGDVELGAGIESLGKNALAGMTIENGSLSLNQVKELARSKDYGDSVFLNTRVDDYLILPKTLKASNLDGSSFVSLTAKGISALDGDEFYAEDGALMNGDQTRFITYMRTNTAKSYELPDTVKVIDPYAFCYNSNLQEVEIKDGLEEIGCCGLAYSSGDNCYYIPDSVAKLADKALGYAFIAGYPDKVPGAIIVTDSYDSAAAEYAAQNDIAQSVGVPSVEKEEASLMGYLNGKMVVNGLDSSRIYYSSTDPEIASIDEKGVITPHEVGTTYVVAAEGTAYFKEKVTITAAGAEYVPNFNYSEYAPVTDPDKFLEDYIAANDDVAFNEADNPSIRYYSTNDYPILKAILDGPARYKTYEEQYGDLGFFRQINKNIHSEIGQYRLHENVVTYSGTNYMPSWTGTGNTLKDLYESVGREFTFANLTSTSLSYSTADGFATGNYRTVIEFYQGAGTSDSVYLKAFSQYESENELLMNYDQEYKILDAGVKYLEDYGFERYIKVAPNYSLQSGLAINKAEIKLKKTSYKYTGENIEPRVSVRYPYMDGTKLKYAKLAEGIDYLLDYENNINAGKGKITVTGIGAYCGSSQLSFIIEQADLAGCSIEAIADYDYLPEAADLQERLHLKYKGREVDSEDYYVANMVRSTGKDDSTLISFTVNAKDMGNFCGSSKQSVTVKVNSQAASCSDNFILKLNSQQPISYSGKPCKPSVTVYDTNGVKVPSGNYSLVYLNNIEAGQATVYAAGRDGYCGESEALTFTIEKAYLASASIKSGKTLAGLCVDDVRFTGKYGRDSLHRDVDYSVENKEEVISGNFAYVTLTALEGNYTGSTTVKLKLSKRVFSPVTTKVYYDEASEEVSVYYGNTLLEEGLDYSKVIKAGKEGVINVTVKGMGNYSGSRKAKF